MKIYLTGARGFTGMHFVSIAEDAGHTVFQARADLLDQAAIEAELLNFQPDAIVHLAAISFVGHGDRAEIYNVNIIGTENLLSAALAANPDIQKILIASSANVYGNTNKVPVDETLLPNPVNHYAISKLGVEFIAQNFADRLPIVITRPFNYTGVGQDEKFLVPKIVSHFVQKKPTIELGNLNIRREFNDVRFVCECYLKLLTPSSATILTVNICSGVHYSISDIISVLGDLTHHDIAIDVNPDFIRQNDILELYGDPGLLHKTIGISKNYTLEDTLQRMIEMG